MLSSDDNAEAQVNTYSTTNSCISLCNQVIVTYNFTYQVAGVEYACNTPNYMVQASSLMNAAAKGASQASAPEAQH